MTNATAPRHLVIALVICAALALLAFPPPAMEGELSVAAALVLFIIGLFATGVLPEQFVALVFFFLAMVLAIAPPTVVFSGFTSGAFWLVFGGLVIGAAIEKTGLGSRIAATVIDRISGGYGSVIAAIILVNMALIFLMPSTLSRVIMLVPVVIAVAERLGYERGGRQRNGMVMAAVLSAYLCSTSVLPANVPNNILLGAAETYQGLQIRYFDYLLLHYPVLGLLKAVVVWSCIVWLFGAPPTVRPGTSSGSAGETPSAKVTGGEKRLCAMLSVALLLWVTDSIHGIAPAWVSLGAGLVCLIPFFGILSPEEFREKVQVGPLLYVGGIIGIGAVVSETGLGQTFSRAVLDAITLSPDAPLVSFTILSNLAMVLGAFSTMPGVPAILVPIADDMRAVSGLSVEAVIMTQVVGFSTVWFPYQVPPIVLGMQLGAVPLAAGLRATLATAVASILMLFPLNSLWWRFLGYLPDGVFW